MSQWCYYKVRIFTVGCHTLIVGCHAFQIQRFRKINHYFVTIFCIMPQKGTIFLLSSHFLFVFWYEWGFTYNFLLTIMQLCWQVVSDSIIFNLDLLLSFRLVFSFLSFKISASRNLIYFDCCYFQIFCILLFLHLNY